MTDVRPFAWAKAPYFSEEGDIFFRPEDSALCDLYCGQIVNDGMSLAIIGANDACADHYCRILVKRLTAIPETQLEMHSPTSTEELLDRFNEILASLSTAEAMDKRNPTAPLQVLILNKADRINPAGARLLARLVNNFPGANTQLILLQTDSSRGTLLDLFGKRLLRWSVPLPSGANALALLAAAKQIGLEDETTRLLRKVNPNALDQPPREPILIAADMDETVPEPEPDIQPLAPEYVPGSKEHKERSMLYTALISTVMIALSAVIVALLFPRQTEFLHSTLLARGSNTAYAPAASPSQVPAIVEPAKLEPVPAPAAKLENTVPVATAATPPPSAASGPVDSATLERLEVVRGPRTPELPTQPHRETTAAPNDRSGPPISAAVAIAKPLAQTPGAPAVAPTAAPAPEGAKAVRNSGLPTPATTKIPQSPARETQIATPAPTGNTQLKTNALAKADTSASASSRNVATPPQPSARVSMQAAVQKVRSTPAQYIFVQHIALDSYSDAQEWQRDNPPLAKALIATVQIGAGTKVKYVVFSGPFKSQAAAMAFNKRHDIPAQPWLRTAASLAKALPQDN